MHDKDRQHPLFYGRRKGKPLRMTRQSALDEIMQSASLSLPENGGKIDPASLFSFRPEQIWMEIGFGAGEQLAYQAQNNPRIGMIGCEPFMNGVAALCKDMREHNLGNIRIWPDDARLLLPRLPDHCLDRLFLLNSDPWPKTRHQKRRFVQKETLDEVHRLLKPGAEFRMSSDHPVLAAWQLEKTYFHGGFKWLAERSTDWTERPSDMLPTRYQQKGAEAGRPTVFLRFQAV